MNLLITGVAGFIGSHTSEKLLSDGHNVIGIDNFDPFYDRSYKEYNLRKSREYASFTFVEGDIRDVHCLDSIFMEANIDIVIHLAAKAGVRPSIADLAGYYDVNLNGTMCILNSMQKHMVKKMVFASSSSVYGNSDDVPFSENQNVDLPISPYAASKKSGELLCHVFSHLYNFDINCLRFFTVFGPRQRPDLAIHKFTKLIDNDMPIPFYGDGSTSRDYTYVDDIVSGILCSLSNLDGYNVFNLGESNVVALSDLIKLIENSLGKKAKINQLPLQPGDVKATFANIEKAKSMLGYDPQYDMGTGIENFVSWYRSVKEIFKSQI
jgi:UDP-glucuronate 4-epimerase